MTPAKYLTLQNYCSRSRSLERMRKWVLHSWWAVKTSSSPSLFFACQMQIRARVNANAAHRLPAMSQMSRNARQEIKFTRNCTKPRKLLHIHLPGYTAGDYYCKGLGCWWSWCFLLKQSCQRLQISFSVSLAWPQAQWQINVHVNSGRIYPKIKPEMERYNLF